MRTNFNDLLLDLPVDCRKAAKAAMLLSVSGEEIDTTTAREAIKSLVEAMYRTKRRRISDKITDGFRRKLVGARVPASDYLRYSEAAEAQGLSLYRWVCGALDAAAAAQAAEAVPSSPAGLPGTTPSSFRSAPRRTAGRGGYCGVLP